MGEEGAMMHPGLPESERAQLDLRLFGAEMAISEATGAALRATFPRVRFAEVEEEEDNVVFKEEDDAGELDDDDDDSDFEIDDFDFMPALLRPSGGTTRDGKGGDSEGEEEEDLSHLLTELEKLEL